MFAAALVAYAMFIVPIIFICIGFVKELIIKATKTGTSEYSAIDRQHHLQNVEEVSFILGGVVAMAVPSALYALSQMF